MTKKKTEKKGKHGGSREGSGKPTFFRGKYTGSGKDVSLKISEGAADMMDEKRTALSAELESRPGKGFPRDVSRNTFLEALIRKNGASLTVADIFRLDGSFK